MATIPFTTTSLSVIPTLVAQWTPMQNGDVGGAFSCAEYTDKSVQVFGTFGSGGSVTLQGSNDGTHWVALSDPQGNVIAITAAGIKMIEEATFFIRPAVTAGDGTTSITCLAMVKK